MEEEIRIVPIREEDIPAYHEAVGTVARERRYLLFVDAPPLEASEQFVRHNLERGYPHYVVHDGETLVGWADIVPREREGLGHCGILGMGLLPAFRGRGLGRRLLGFTLEAAWARGFSRVELEAMSSNTSAIALYRKLGFVEEGRKRRARYLDGRWDDFVIMAIFADSARAEPGAESRSETQAVQPHE